MGCGRSSLKSNTSDSTKIEEVKAAEVKTTEEKAKQEESSYENAKNLITKHLETLPQIADENMLSDTLIFGNSITPSKAFPFTIYYKKQVSNDPTITYETGSINVTLYSMPNELLFRNNIVLFTFNSSSIDYSRFRLLCIIELYEADINPNNLDLYLLVNEGKARRVPSQQITSDTKKTVFALYNITLNSDKYYQVIISSRESPDYPKNREIIYYKSSVKQYMGIDGFKNKNFYNIEGYMENHPLLPKNYYPFKL